MATKKVETDEAEYEGMTAENIDASIGNISRKGKKEPVETKGIKTRGNGAAKRGTTARGPMA